jgi:ABC-2 type transport system permease protein
MIASTFRLELRRDRSLVIWVGVITFIYGGTMALFYPVMKENMAALEEYMKIFPKEFLAAFGMTGSLAQPGVFFSTYIGSWLWPVIAAIVAVLAATRPVGADLDRGFLELVITTPLSRRRYLAVSIVGQILVVFAIAITTVGGVLAMGVVAGTGFDAARFLAVIPLATAFGCAIAAFATLVSVVTLSRGIGGGVTAGVLLVMYLGHVVAQIQPDLSWLSSISAFGHFRTSPIIDEGVSSAPDLALFVVAALGCWLAALWAFGRRDLAA